jgi:hypothetical protein
MATQPQSSTGLVVFTSSHASTVAFDPASKMWSLTEMHIAAGAPANKNPRQWLRSTQAQEFVEALAAHVGVHVTDVEISHIGLVETRRGGVEGGGTWAHWQIAAAYAHYLSPAFYIQWNEWAMAYRTRRPRPRHTIAALAPSRMALALDVADRFHAAGHRLTASMLAAELGITHGAAHRYFVAIPAQQPERWTVATTPAGRGRPPLTLCPAP